MFLIYVVCSWQCNVENGGVFVVLFNGDFGYSCIVCICKCGGCGIVRCECQIDYNWFSCMLMLYGIVVSDYELDVVICICIVLIGFYICLFKNRFFNCNVQCSVDLFGGINMQCVVQFFDDVGNLNEFFVICKGVIFCGCVGVGNSERKVSDVIYIGYYILDIIDSVIKFCVHGGIQVGI